jgi:hypothetical protein
LYRNAKPEPGLVDGSGILNNFSYFTTVLERANVGKGEGSTARNSSAQKNCSTPKSQLLDTVRADDKNILICSKIKKVCRTCRVKQMQVLDQNEQLLKLHLLDKR